PRSGLRTRVVVVDSNAALRTVVDALRRAGHLPQHALSVRDRVVDLQEHVVTGSVACLQEQLAVAGRDVANLDAGRCSVEIDRAGAARGAGDNGVGADRTIELAAGGAER